MAAIRATHQITPFLRRYWTTSNWSTLIQHIGGKDSLSDGFAFSRQATRCGTTWYWRRQPSHRLPFSKSCRNTRLELSSCCAPDQRKVGPPFASQGRSRTPAIFNGIVPFNFPLGPVQIGYLKKRASGSRNAASPPKRKSNVSAPSPTNTATTNRPSRTRVTVVGQSASRGRLGCF